MSAKEKGTPVRFVGAGPGDPELITVKGLKALREADLVVYAGSLVNPELLQELKAGAEARDSAPLELGEIVALMATAFGAGKKVVRLHTGDPSVYGAIQEQMAELEERGVPCEVVPGVTAAFAAAAALRQELTLPGVSQTVILTRLEGRTPVPPSEGLDRIAAIGGTVCLYLSSALVEEAAKRLLAGGRFTPATPAVAVSRASWKDELIVEGTLADIAGKIRNAGIDRQAVILVGEALRSRREGMLERSKLYDPDFAHGFRKAKDRGKRTEG